MHLTTLLPTFVIPLAVGSSILSSQHIFSIPSSSSESAYLRIPTIHESAIQARRILNLETIGTLSTVFPSDGSLSPLEDRPSGLGGSPIGLMDYFGDCQPSTGNPTILAIGIATSFKNVAAGSNISLSLRWHPPDSNLRRYSAANLPRFSLIGHLEELSKEEEAEERVASCFVRKHPDAVAWLPGNPIHESKWVRLVVKQIYWIGGFGNQAYIGWIPPEVWRNVTVKEVDECRLPGEKAGSWMKWLRWDLLPVIVGSGSQVN